MPDSDGASSTVARIRSPIHVFLFPYIEQDTLYKQMVVAAGNDRYYSPVAKPLGGQVRCDATAVPPLISPNDPSHSGGLDPQGRGVTSYAANAHLFAKTDRQGLLVGELTGLSGQFDRGYPIPLIPDGSSNTIAFSEKYGSCGNGGSLWSAGIGNQPIRSIPANTKADPYYWPVFGLARDAGVPDRAYGADPAADPSKSRLVFQSQPNPYTTHKGLDSPIDATGCDAFRASTPYSSGILVGMADGSLRVIRKGIDPQVWFYLLYPDDGKTIELD